MANVGRNDPCPCGSGKKYKRCCWGKAPARPDPPKPPKPPSAQAADILAGEPEGALWVPDAASPFGGYVMVEDDIDRLSNRANDLIRTGRFDEAEALCRQLAEEFPDQIDSITRSAQLDEARGELAKAAAYYRKAVEFARTHDGFDEDSIAYYTEDAERLEDAIQAAEQPPEPDGPPGT